MTGRWEWLTSQSAEWWAALGTWAAAIVGLAVAYAAVKGLRVSNRLAQQLREERTLEALDAFLDFLDYVQRSHPSDYAGPEAEQGEVERLDRWIRDLWSRWQPLYRLKSRRFGDHKIADRLRRFNALLRVAARDVPTLHHFKRVEFMDEETRRAEQLICYPALPLRLHMAATALTDDLIAFEVGEAMPACRLPAEDRAHAFLMAEPLDDVGGYV